MALKKISYILTMQIFQMDLYAICQAILDSLYYLLVSCKRKTCPSNGWQRQIDVHSALDEKESAV